MKISNNKRKNILPQTFDVKPVKRDGFLDLEKIKSVKRTLILDEKIQERRIIIPKIIPSNKKKIIPNQEFTRPDALKRNFIQKTKKGLEYEHPEFRPSQQEDRENYEIFQPRPEKLKHFFEVAPEIIPPVSPARIKKEQILPQQEYKIENFQNPPKKKKKTKTWFQKSVLKKKKRKFGSGKSSVSRELDKIFSPNYAYISKFNYAFSFAAVLIIFSFSVSFFSHIEKALSLKNTITQSGQQALSQIAEAKDNLTTSQFDQAAVDFSESYQILSDAEKNIDEIGGNFSDILRFVPGISRIASADYIISAGKHFSLAGKTLSESAKSLNSLGNPLDETSAGNQPSLTDLFLNLRDGVNQASSELSQGEEDLNKVNLDDLPAETREEFTALKTKLPVVNTSLKNFLDYSQIFLDVLGYNGPRKYLFLFENNQEMRATGGFIGSYGILDISNGRVKKLFVDDIYNPDGQLRARVIPPAPIQKMSAVWTMHDANWFPDFPTSAEKVSWFYEKTGGPTVDGVIAITPELLRDLLKITGPIDMQEYEKTIDAENFIEETQQEVEMDYDKELNQPKKFVADLTPKILDKVMSEKGITQLLATLKAFDSALSEKHMLLYSRNYNVQKLISNQKWSGEILNTDKDYLSVINTNINGFKTDGVIEETINHRSEIQDDGIIIDTVSITRQHNGGNEEYDWWNKVSGDWMRVYVPKDAKLLEVSGQTREIVPPALDYASLGFKKDPQVQAEEDSTRIDDQSGTRVYQENQKTVFANWVYVSPGESVTINYKYILPFKLSFDPLHHPADSFSVLFQKQSGSVGSKLHSEIKIPDHMHSIWRWPDNLRQEGNSLKMETILTEDKFAGIAVERQ